MTIKIDNPEVESFINFQYGQDEDSLLRDFMTFVRTEAVSRELKKGFDEVELFKQGKKSLNSFDEVASRLRSAD